MTSLTGSCLCGSVRYQIAGESLAFYHCHCQRCRKMTGTGHASNIRIAAAGVNWLAGEELIGSYKVPEAERFRNDFCTRCGSPLPKYFPSINAITVPAGTLDTEPDLQPQARIFCESRTSWSCAGDGLKEYQTYPKT